MKRRRKRRWRSSTENRQKLTVKSKVTMLKHSAEKGVKQSKLCTHLILST